MSPPDPASADLPAPAARGGDARPSTAAAIDAAFLLGENPPTAPAVMRGVAALYERLLTAIRGLPGAPLLTRDQFLFFVLSAAGLALLMPRAVAVIAYSIERFVLRMPVAKPALAGWPSLPTLLLPFVAAALLLFFVRPSVRLKALLLFSLAGGFAFGYLDLPSFLMFAVFGALCFAVIRLPISRLAAAVTLGLLSSGLLFLSVFWHEDSAIVTVATFQTTLLPALWYSAYQHKVPRRPLEVRQFAVYLYARFFSGPVFTYSDLFTPVSQARLAEVRLGGMKALYIAAFASIAAAGTDLLWQRFPADGMIGLPLLLISYAGYVGERCKIVVGFNVVSGVLRLFGVPLRDNFQYWLLARTPNEHWQRWNILFREWVITFVFFPIMKTRRWLFAAVMAALLASGLLHVVPAALTQSQTRFATTIQLGYWVANGLAIYLVIKIPALFPKLVPALGMPGSVSWSMVGVLATSSFYAVLYGVRAGSNNWTDVARYFERLVSLF